MNADSGMRLRSGLALLLTLAAPPAASTLLEVGAQRGVQPYVMARVMGGGVAASDVDGDGDVDFFVPNAEDVADQFYLNQGGGQFAEQAASSGLASLLRSRAGLWMDIDSDHDLDLVVAGDCFGEWALEPGSVPCRPNRPMLRLFRQDPGRVFVDITAGSGLEQDAGLFENGHHRAGLASGDLDGDGDLDLYAAHWYGPSKLYFNDGAGHFTDVTVSSGVHRPGTAQWQPVIFDIDGNGHQDIFVAVDFTENFLFMNQGNGQFVDAATDAGVAQTWNDMGVAVGDYDNDGDFDLYVTHVHERSPGEHNTLLRNDSTPGHPVFTDVADLVGVADTSWGWGATFADADLDGDLDLFATNGFAASDGAQYPTDPSKAFRNDGAAFADVSDAWGFNDTLWGSSLVCFDLEGDGKPDLLQTTKVHPTPGPLRMLTNALPGPGGFLRVVPRQTAGNTQAIGAVITIRHGATQQHRLVTAGISFMGQEPAEAHFGLGANQRVDEVRIRWPHGGETVRRSVPAGRSVLIHDDELHHADFD
jgi:hypothetical protein